MLKKRRILVEGSAVTEPHISGVGNVAVNIIHFLASDPNISNKYSIEVAVPFNKTHFLLQHHFPDSVKIKKIFIPGKIMNAITKLRIVPYMDVFLGRGVYIFPNFKNWPLLFSRSITYIHDLAFLRYPEFIEDKNLRYLQAHIKEFLYRADDIVTVSDHAVSEIKKYFPEYATKVKRVYNGISSEKVRLQDLQAQLRVAKKYQLKNKEYFIFISNMEPRKNVIGLLKAFKLFCDDHNLKSKISLLLVGGLGWKNEEALKLMHRLQSEGYQIIKPTNYVTDSEKIALLSGSAGLIHPAFYEGFGLSPLEAMACGINVAVANNSSLPEVVGDTGYYMDNLTHEGIAEGLSWLYKNRTHPNARGVDRSKEFLWQKTLEPLRDIIDRQEV